MGRREKMLREKADRIAERADKMAESDLEVERNRAHDLRLARIDLLIAAEQTGAIEENSRLLKRLIKLLSPALAKCCKCEEAPCACEALGLNDTEAA